MQKVGINELYKMILEEMDLEEKYDQAKQQKKRNRQLSKLVLNKTFQEYSDQIDLSPEQRAKMALDIINKKLNELTGTDDGSEESALNDKYRASLENALQTAEEKLGATKEELEALIKKGLENEKNKNNTGSAEQEADPELPPKFKQAYELFQNFNQQIQDPDNTTKQQLEAAAESQSITLEALEKYYNDVIGSVKAEERRFPNFMKELNKFARAYKTAKSNETPEENEESKSVNDLFLDFVNISNLITKMQNDEKSQEQIYSKIRSDYGYTPESLKQKIDKVFQNRDEIIKAKKGKDLFSAADELSSTLEALTKEPEEQEVDQELEELKSDLEALRKFTDELTKIKREKGLLSESIIIEETAEEEPAEQQKLSRSDLEDAAKAAGADYDYFKNLVDKLSKGGLLVKYSEEEEVAAAKEAIGEFQTLSRQTRSDEEVYRDIIASYKAAVAKRKAENPEELDEIEARSKTVIAAMKKAWENKDKELPGGVEEEVEETIEENPPELSLDQELEAVEALITNAINIALDPTATIIPPRQPSDPSKEGEDLGENVSASGLGQAGDAVTALGTGAALGSGIGWMLGLGALSAPPLFAGVALGSAAVALLARSKGRKLRKAQDNIFKSIEYGLGTFVKTIANTLGGPAVDESVEKVRELAKAYSMIVDENYKLKLNKVDKSKVKTMISDIFTKDQKDKIKIGNDMSAPLEGDVLQGEMGATLKKFAKIILYSNVGKVNESREKDKKAMLKFLKSYKKSRGRDYEAILKSEFNDKERDALVYWFSDKKRGKEFVKTYFKDGAALFDDSAIDTLTSALKDTADVRGDDGGDEEGEDDTTSSSHEDFHPSDAPGKRDDDMFAEDANALGEALKPIIRSVIKEILEK